VITIDLFWVGLAILCVPALLVVCAFVCAAHDQSKNLSTSGWDNLRNVMYTVGAALVIALGLFLTIYFRGES